MPRIAEAAAKIAAAFADYCAEFRAITRRSKTRFEAMEWQTHERDALERLELYGRFMEDLKPEMRALLGDLAEDRRIWAGIKSAYAEQADARNFELARTFFNSITRRVFGTVGVNRDIEFATLDLAIRDWEPERRILREHTGGDTRQLLSGILEDYRFDVDYRDPAHDVEFAARRIEDRIREKLGTERIDHVQVLRPVFFRHKAAYIMGRVICGDRSLPLVLALLNSREGVFIDAVLMREREVSILFSFTRSYFHVDVECPREVIVFLRTIIPLKPVTELYSTLGFNKHGKTELYRSLQRHLDRTTDLFEFASGDPGMVMLVFTLPSYDRVFKVIRNTFASPKKTTPREVIERYRLVFKRDRVGRMIEAQRFLQLKFKLNRFADDLLEELLRDTSNVVKREGDFLVFQHLYTERKVTPLNLYLRDADPAAARQAVIDYGAAIKELATANIFPGDFLLKNFGVTRHGRVVFYDYDELCLVTDCRFRRMPIPRTPEEELAPDPWFAAADNDVFPEEFRGFLGLTGELAEIFDRHHGDLFTPAFWRAQQRHHEEQTIPDFFPYPESERLRLESSD